MQILLVPPKGWTQARTDAVKSGLADEISITRSFHSEVDAVLVIVGDTPDFDTLGKLRPRFGNIDIWYESSEEPEQVRAKIAKITQPPAA